MTDLIYFLLVKCAQLTSPIISHIAVLKQVNGQYSNSSCAAFNFNLPYIEIFKAQMLLSLTH